MKIVAVSTWFPSPQDPVAGAFVDKDVRALAERHDVEVVHLTPRAEPGTAPGRLVTEVVDGLTVHRVPMSTQRPDQMWAARRAMAPVLADADVLHTMAFSSILPCLLGPRPAQPWVHTEHWQGVTARWHLPLAWRAVMPALSRVLLRPDVVTAVSDYATAPIARLRGGRPTDVVPCLVREVTPAPRRHREDGVLRLVAVGMLAPMKDPVTAVRTVALLRERGVAAELTWVGDGPLREETLAEADRLGVTDQVRLVGPRDSAGVSAELAAADLFFLPTRRETFGVAIAEALAHGRPVVVGGTGAQSEYVRDDVGSLVDVQDPSSYAEAILDLDARTATTTAESVAATVAGRFTPEVVVAGYEKAYRTAASIARTEIPGPSGASGAGGSTTDSAETAADAAERDVAELDGAESSTHPPTHAPTVDLVIAVHTAQRPIARAVQSVLKNDAAVRVTVVCHNLDPALVDDNLRDVEVPARSSVRTVAYADATRSPAGPFNHGLDLATAPWVAVMGSDDRLAPGAVDSWLACAERTGAGTVIARLAHAGGAVVPTPPVRPWHKGRVDGVKDRLSYRSAPLGLIDRAVLDRDQIRFVAGLPVGEDVAVVTRLWFGSAGVTFDRSGPAYLIEDDAGDRVTYTVRPVGEELAFVHDLLARPWFRAMTLRQRRAVGVKLLRIHVFGILLNREPDFWSAEERAALRNTAAAVLAAAPGCQTVLSRADHAVLDAIGSHRSAQAESAEKDAAVPGTSGSRAVPVEELLRVAQARRRHGRPQTLVPRDLSRVFAREAPLRLMTASVLVRWAIGDAWPLRQLIPAVRLGDLEVSRQRFSSGGNPDDR